MTTIATTRIEARIAELETERDQIRRQAEQQLAGYATAIYELQQLLLPEPTGDEPAGDEPAGDEPAGDEPAA